MFKLLEFWFIPRKSREMWSTIAFEISTVGHIGDDNIFIRKRDEHRARMLNESTSTIVTLFPVLLYLSPTNGIIDKNMLLQRRVRSEEHIFDVRLTYC